MRVRGAAVVACLALLAGACSGGGADAEVADETAVLGAVAERTSLPATESPQVEPTQRATTSDTEPATAATATDAPPPAAEPTAPATTSAPPTPRPEPAPTEPPQPEPPGSPPATDPEGPVLLHTGPGWSYNTLLPDADGEGWTEVGGPPPVGEDGASVEQLLTRLLHETTAGDAAGRLARCTTWLEAPPHAPLRVRGEVIVELLVGDDAAARSSHRIDTTLAPGQRRDLPAWERPARLHAAEGQSVACTAWFSGDG